IGRYDLFARRYFLQVDDGTVRQGENSGTFRGDFSDGISKRPDMAPKEIADTPSCHKSEHLHVELIHRYFVYLPSFKRTLLRLKLFNAKSFRFWRCCQFTERIWR